MLEIHATKDVKFIFALVVYIVNEGSIDYILFYVSKQ